MVVKKRLIEWEKQDGVTTAWKDDKTGDVLYIRRDGEGSLLWKGIEAIDKMLDQRRIIDELIVERDELKESYKILLERREKLQEQYQLLSNDFKILNNKHTELKRKQNKSENNKSNKSAEPDESPKTLLDKGKILDKIGEFRAYDIPYNDIINSLADGKWHPYSELTETLSKYYKMEKSRTKYVNNRYLKSISKKYRVSRGRIPNESGWQFKIEPKTVTTNVDKKKTPHVKMQRRTNLKI